MRTLLFPPPRSLASAGWAPPSASVGAAQRASLGRGLVFVLLLAAASLASVYVPLALRGPDWIEGTAAGPTVAAR